MGLTIRTGQPGAGSDLRGRGPGGTGRQEQDVGDRWERGRGRQRVRSHRGSQGSGGATGEATVFPQEEGNSVGLEGQGRMKECWL